MEMEGFLCPNRDNVVFGIVFHNPLVCRIRHFQCAAFADRTGGQFAVQGCNIESRFSRTAMLHGNIPNALSRLYCYFLHNN